MIEQFGLSPTNAKLVLVGDVFTELSVVAIGQKGRYRYFSVCACSCGSPLKAVRSDHLLSGKTISCGCIQKERTITHGLTDSIHYDRWRGMIDRCENTSCDSYKNYGGRGISVCERWHDIALFIADLPPAYWQGAQIDRINNDGNYEPGNIRWSTPSENSSNRRSARLLTFDGRTQSQREWAVELGIKDRLIDNRLRLGWTLEKALTVTSMSSKERMAKAHETRWLGHTKKPAPPPMVRRYFEYQGQKLTVTELSEICGVPVKLLRKRLIERGWPIEKAIQK